jgi:hypothetical protein
MGLLNDVYDAADRVAAAHEAKKREQDAKKALAKKKAQEAANKQSDSGLFL